MQVRIQKYISIFLQSSVLIYQLYFYISSRRK